MPKYYIPTTDEFHSGFKFETKQENNFIKSSYTSSLQDDDITKYRVKYLDIDDLKDLGFVIKQELSDYTVLYKNIVNNDSPLYYIINFMEIHGLPYIELQDMYNHPMIARIHIKNKNELEWLLNRYGLL